MPVFTPQAIANTVAMIAQELKTAVGQAATAAGANPDVVKQINEGIDGLSSAAAALGSAEQASQAQPILDRIMADANAVIAAMAMLPLPPQAVIVMRIVQVLLPTVQAAAAIIWPAKPLAAMAQEEAAQQPQQPEQPQQPQPPSPAENIDPAQVAQGQTPARSDAPQTPPKEQA